MCERSARVRCTGCARAFCGEQCAAGHRCIHNHYDSAQALYFVDNIETRALNNARPFALVYQEGAPAGRLQVAVASVRDEIPLETHADVTQFVRVERGYGRLEMAGKTWALSAGESFVVPAGTPHRIVNEGTKPLQLYTIYAKDSGAPEWKH